jgi:hypothetical protein
LASTAIRTSGPQTSRATRIRRMSSARSVPTFSLIWNNPSASAALHNSRSLSSSYPSQPGELV